MASRFPHVMPPEATAAQIVAGQEQMTRDLTTKLQAASRTSLKKISALRSNQPLHSPVSSCRSVEGCARPLISRTGRNRRGGFCQAHSWWNIPAIGCVFLET
jgi:hypothetical protein